MSLRNIAIFQVTTV